MPVSVVQGPQLPKNHTVLLFRKRLEILDEVMARWCKAPMAPRTVSGRMIDVYSLHPELLRDVIFIRHAEPLVEPDRPPAEWQLSLKGRELSYELGACLSPTGLRRIVSSPEEKARTTATALAEVLGVRVVTDDRLREVQRPWTDGNFADVVARYLQGDLIEGWEPVEQVVSRLEAFLVSRPSEGPIGVVTHGTAMTCLLSADDSTNRARFWSELKMPDAWSFSQEGPMRLDCLRT